jgi:hypothetical protein
MTDLLEILGVLSLVFVGGFTWYQITHVDQGRGQTKRGSMIEAWTNIAVGFAVNFVANIFFLPLVGASFTLAENFWLGWIYTAISVVRQFAIRRWYNREQK